MRNRPPGWHMMISWKSNERRHCASLCTFSSWLEYAGPHFPTETCASVGLRNASIAIVRFEQRLGLGGMLGFHLQRWCFFLIPDILLSFQPEIEHLIKFQKYSGCMVDAHLWGHQCKTSRSEYVVGPWGHVDSCFTVIDFTSGVCWCLKGVGV